MDPAPGRGAQGRRRRRALRQLLVLAGLAPFLLSVLFPLWWMVVTALKHERELYRLGPSPFWLAEGPTLKHVHLLFTQTWFATWTLNTALVALAVAAITLATAVPAAYALCRLRLPGAAPTAIALFTTYLVPPVVLFLPLAAVASALGVMDSIWALVVLYPTFTIPLGTWLMMGFLRAVPIELEEAAWIDGCGLVGGLLRVVLPLSWPGILTTGCFAVILTVQEYLYALVLSSPVDHKVLAVGLPTMLIRGDIFFWGALMAAALLVGLPLALLFGAVLDHFIRGLTGAGDR